MKLLLQPTGPDRLGDRLKASLAQPEWTQFQAAVAFVKRSGVKHIAPLLAAFAKARRTEIIVGIDHQGTSYEGLGDLLQAVSPNGHVFVLHNRLPLTFHPKMYLFKSVTAAEIIVGSGNLTEGGLFTNYEASLRARLDLAHKDDAHLLGLFESTFAGWLDSTKGTVQVLDEDFLNQLRDLGLVPMEGLPASGKGKSEPQVNSLGFPFAAHPERRAPESTQRLLAEGQTTGVAGQKGEMVDSAGQPRTPACFVMTLQQTDVGIGQATAGTSKRSPEIFIPLGARNVNPTFWDWPDGFTPDPANPGKFDRHATVRIGGQIVQVNMMTWPDKHDFRLRSEALRSAGVVGDILRMERVGSELGFDYYVEIIPLGIDQHLDHLRRCNSLVRGKSKKRYGYF